MQILSFLFAISLVNLCLCRHLTSIILLDIHSEAKVVLVVEKDATFQRLLDDGVLRRLKPCILVTVSKVQNKTLLTDVSSRVCVVNCIYVCCVQGKGVPDVNTRMLLRRLWETLQLPTLVLVDADPHGAYVVTICRALVRSTPITSRLVAS